VERRKTPDTGVERHRSHENTSPAAEKRQKERAPGLSFPVIFSSLRNKRELDSKEEKTRRSDLR